jgi:hypothetical protein
VSWAAAAAARGGGGGGGGSGPAAWFEQCICCVQTRHSLLGNGQQHGKDPQHR